MQKNYTTMICAIGAAALALPAYGVTTSTFTADNHYSIYGDYAGSISFIGANESGAAGSPGQYNWSMAETFTFATPDTFYIAAWSDDNVAQGLLGQFDVGGTMLLTGGAGWEVFATGINLNDGDPAPDASTIASQVALADANELWEAPYVGFENSPAAMNWGQVAGVSEDARWVWRDSGRGGPDPLLQGYNHDEFLIFRTAVPAPGGVALIALASIAAVRRRRIA